jgi:hypothetical protein
MKKILVASAACLTFLSAFPLMAKDFSDMSNDNGLISMNVPVNASCMQDIVRSRGTSLVDAYNTYNSSIVAALKIRTDAQVNAWATSDSNQRTIALTASERTFTSSYNTASWTLERTKQNLRKQSTLAEKNCKNGRTNSSSSTSSSVSSALSQSSNNSSTSVACSNLTGTLTGAFTIASMIPDVGHTYAITGSGSVSAIGTVSVNGSVHSLGFIANGNATGDITVTQGSSTMTLHLTGPVQTGFSALPVKFHYVIQSAIGIFAQYANNSGTLELHLKGDTNGSFNLQLTGRCDW